MASNSADSVRVPSKARKPELAAEDEVRDWRLYPTRAHVDQDDVTNGTNGKIPQRRPRADSDLSTISITVDEAPPLTDADAWPTLDEPTKKLAPTMTLNRISNVSCSDLANTVQKNEPLNEAPRGPDDDDLASEASSWVEDLGATSDWTLVADDLSKDWEDIGPRPRSYSDAVRRLATKPPPCCARFKAAPKRSLRPGGGFGKQAQVSEDCLAFHDDFCGPSPEADYYRRTRRSESALRSRDKRLAHNAQVIRA